MILEQSTRSWPLRAPLLTAIVTIAIAIAIAIAVTSPTAIAAQPKADEQVVMWYCSAFAGAAEIGARKRREGVSLADTLTAMLMGVPEEERLLVYVPAVIDAYKGPIGVRAHDPEGYKASKLSACMKAEGY